MASFFDMNDKVTTDNHSSHYIPLYPAHLVPAAVVAAGQGRGCGGAAAALQGPDHIIKFVSVNLLIAATCSSRRSEYSALC